MPLVVHSDTSSSELLKRKQKRSSAGVRSIEALLGTVRVMSYNIRYDTPEDGENRWSRRRHLVASMLSRYGAEVGGLQEVKKHQLEELKEHLPHLVFLGVGRDDGEEEGEHVPIFFSPKRFNLVKNGHFWLSEEPHVPGSKSWGTACPRMAVWAVLEERLSKERIIAINTHLDHVSMEAQLKGSELILHHIKSLMSAEPSNPKVMLFGDFNALPTSPCVELYGRNEIYKLRSGREITTRAIGPRGTFTGWTLPKLAKHGEEEEEGTLEIDFIFVDSKTEILQYVVPTDTFEGKQASDHRPVFADVILRPLLN